MTLDESKKYLSEMLWKNVTNLADSLGRYLDDAILIMCECILNVAKDFSRERNKASWDSIQSREQWEQIFHNKYLLPVFQTLDDRIKESTKKMTSEKEMIENNFHRITHDVGIQINQEERMTRFHPILWSVIKHPNVAHVMQSIGDTSSPGVIQKILQTPKLYLARHLEDVLNLQKILIDKYREKDLSDVEKITFENFMGDQGFKYKDLVDKYFSIWNSIRNSISLGKNQKLEEYMVEMNMKSPVAMGLPSSRGHGRCARLLSLYLIQIHNDFVRECEAVLKQNSKATVTVPQLVPSNFIRFDKDRDLMKMIHTHTSYIIERDSHGSHHLITYNIDALEKQAREDYANYSPIIDAESLPCMRYPQDIGIGSDWTKTKEKQEKQVTLTLEVAQEVDEKVASSKITPADLYGGVRTLTNAIGFLANVEADPEQPIWEYLCKHLSLSEQHLVMIPKSALIKHTLALYQRLTWHKAVNFVQQQLKPYKEALYGVDQVQITDKTILARLKDAFEHMDIGKFQRNLNEILIQVPDIKPFWSLRQDVFPFFEFIEEDVTDNWYNGIPPEICYEHVSHLFELSVNCVPQEMLEN